MSKLKELVEKATPGPWVETYRVPDFGRVNVSYNVGAGGAISIAYGQSQEHLIEQSDAAILEDECKANARLIAKAPELAALVLELAERLRYVEEQSYVDDYGDQVAVLQSYEWRQVADALAKVKALEESL